jgi:triacylglycerol lipase
VETLDPFWSAVDPELASAARALPEMQLEGGGLAAVRAAYGQAYQIADPQLGDTVTVRREVIPAEAGRPPIPLIVYTPNVDAGPRPAILDIHGGGFVLGAAAMNDQQNRRLCSELGAVVVSVDYRLAPDHPYPCAVEDCYGAAIWLQEAAETRGVDPKAVAVIGASAGGGLAAALALLMRDRGRPPFRGIVLLSPMLDDRTCLSEAHPLRGRVSWTPANNRFGWSALLGGPPGGGEVSPYAAPARCESLAGLPPAFISVGALDLFLDEDLAFARRLIDAGVRTEVQVYPGAFHGFARFAPAARASRRATDEAVRALGDFLQSA